MSYGAGSRGLFSGVSDNTPRGLLHCSQVSGNTVTPTHAETQCTHRQRPGERPGMGLAALDGTAAPPMSRVATARSRRRRAR